MQAPSTQDRTEIYELYARYSWALDTGDTDGYVALFTADAEATEETSSGELEVRKGADEIRKLVLKFHRRADFPGHQHQMAQFVFEPDPQGRPRHWVVRCYAWATINRPPAPPHLHWCGHIRDVVAKVDGVWKIRSKDIMGWAGKVLEGFSAHAPAAPRG
jgi:SnoaL-like domain